jgi:Chitobiase/beta-hexosaminidase C-terminal domain/Bacterial Ig-like domain (group 2)/Putative Ig domain
MALIISGIFSGRLKMQKLLPVFALLLTTKRLSTFVFFLLASAASVGQVAHPRIWLDSARMAQLKAQIASTHYGGTGSVDSPEFTSLIAKANTIVTYPILPYDHEVLINGKTYYNYRGSGWYTNIVPVALAYAVTGDTTYSNYVIQWMNMLADTGRILTLTSVAGVNVGDSVTGPNIPAGVSVLAVYPTGNTYNTLPQVRLSNWFTANIPGGSTIVFNGTISLTTPAAGTRYANFYNGDPQHDTNAYSSRNVASALGIAYDWVHDQLTPANIADFSHVLESYWTAVNTWGYQWVGAGYASDNGCGNFSLGHLFGFGLAAIAFEGDDAITNDMFNGTSGITTRLNSRFLPNIQTGCFSSGYASESYNYGVGTIEHLALVLEAYRTSGKSALVGPGQFSSVLPWMQNVVKSTIYNQPPDFWSISQEGEWTATYTGVLNKSYPYMFSGLIGSAAPEGGYALADYRSLNYNNVPSGYPPTAYEFELPTYTAFLWKQPGTGIDYTATLPLYWHGNAAGDHHSIARTDWTGSAIHTSFSAQTRIVTDHQSYTAGHLVIQRGLDRLLITAGYWKGKAGDCCAGGATGNNLYDRHNWVSNTLFASDTTANFCYANYIGCAVSSPTDHGPVAHKETSAYIYSKINLQDVYGRSGGRPFSTYYRSLVTINGISFVYDYLVAVNYATSVRKQFWHTSNLSTASPPGIASAINVAGNTASATVGSSTLWIKALLPASPTITSVQNLGSSAGKWYTSGPAQSTQHFEITDPNQASTPTTQYLTVLAPTASSVGTMPTTSSVSASGFVGALYADSTPRVVLFSADGTAQNAFSYTLTATGKVTHVITDIAPGAYDIFQNATNIGTAVAGADGSLTFTSTNGGTFTNSPGTATLVNITVAPGTASIVAGTGPQKYTAHCTYSNSTNSDCTTSVTWSSTNPAVATISGSGLASAEAAGSATIKAVSGSFSGSGVLTVTAPTLIVTTTSLAGASVGTSYNLQLNASGGVAPYTWALTSGSLPTGLSLSTSGLISGIPTTPISEMPLTFRVTDSASSATLSSGLMLTVAGSSLSLGPGTCASTMTETQYVAFSGCTLAASGGTPPYTYSWKVVTDGSYAALPEGLSLDSSTGTISGTVYGQGRYVPQFVVSDSAGAKAALNTLFFSIAGDNTLGGCSLFPADSIFHQRVDSLPVDTSPAAPIYSGYQSSALRVFFGNGGGGNVPNGIPFIRVPYDQPNVSVTTTVYQSYFSSGPFPAYAPPEATPNHNGDRHVLVVQTAGGGEPCRLWEMWQGIHQANNGWDDSSNAYWPNVGSTGTGAYAMLPQDSGSTDAAGLPIAPLLVTADEVIGTGTPSVPNGSVQHPVRFTLNHMLNRYVWPATAHAGTGSCSGGYSDGNGMLLQGAGAPASCTMTGPAGEIYRLKASAATPACATTSPQAAIIIRGFRNYGIILADNGMTGGLIGTPDARWNDSDLACLTSLTLSDFEPVNVSGVASALTPNYNGSGYSAPVTSYQTNSGAPTLTGITVNPATASIMVGTGSQQYAAQCSYSNGTSSDCKATVTWSISDTVVATISNTGLASALVAGTATIKAVSGSVNGGAVLTVTSSTLIGVTVTPAAASIVAGTRQYAAQCNYSNSTNTDCTAAVTWSSSKPAVATISTSGLANSVAPGRATITAAWGRITGSAVLTVTPIPVDLTSGLWSWMGGSSTAQGVLKGHLGTYSGLGSPSTGNVPGSREASISWTDSSGTLWLFGGGGFDSAGVDGYLNDLWAFIPSSEQWIWRGGSSTVPAANKGWPGIYGTLGAAAAGNSPGGRKASVSWTDKAGNLWLFGGVGYDSAAAHGSLNDLWEYVTSTQEWAWMGGSSTVPADNKGQPGVYGQVGVSDAANIPGGRWGANSWTDVTGNFWLFGGVGYDSTGSLGSLNDLWELNPSTGKWAWVSGSSTVGSGGGQPGVFGSLATPAAANVPSGRSQAVSWTDSNGNFWLFGGKGYDSTGTLGYFNDLWEFNPSTHEWAWMGGSGSIGCPSCDKPGIYGTHGEADSANMPGGRSEAVGWTDNGGNFWLLGGNGYDSAGTNGILNDLWKFLPATRQWAWMGGSNTVPRSDAGQPGMYGNLGVPSAANMPGSRWGGGSWTDGDGNLWLLGGAGFDSQGTYDNLNDLWVYQPYPGNLPAATPTLSVTSGRYNSPQTVAISDATPGATIYYTTNGVTPNVNSDVYSGPITVSTTMTLEAIALANGYKASAAASATYTLDSSFSIAPPAGSASNVTVQPGGVATYSIGVVPIGSSTFPAPITFTASGNPSGWIVTFTPATVAAGVGTTNVSLTIKTSAASASIVRARSNWTIALCLLFLPLIGIRRWRYPGTQLSPRTRIVAEILLLAGLTVAMSGCSGTVINANTGSRTGKPTAYTITVAGTSGNVHQTTTLTLTLQ